MSTALASTGAWTIRTIGAARTCFCLMTPASDGGRGNAPAAPVSYGVEGAAAPLAAAAKPRIGCARVEAGSCRHRSLISAPESGVEICAAGFRPADVDAGDRDAAAAGSARGQYRARFFPRRCEASRNSDKLDAHSAHTEHDQRRNEPGDDRAADHEPIGERLADAMRHHDVTTAGRKMREDNVCL